MSQTFRLPAGQVATVTAHASGAASFWSITEANVPGAPVAVLAGATSAVGPFAAPKIYVMAGAFAPSVAFTTPDPVSDGDTLVNAVLTTPAITGGTITDADFAIGDVRLLTSDGAPDDAVKATLSRNPAGDENGLTFGAVAYGVGGNSITIAYIDPAANDAELGVVVVGNAITVNLATGVAGAITSTAAEILAAIEAAPAADALVTVVINAADSGVADDGSGIVTALASAPMTGGQGTGIGTAGIGSLCADYTNGKLYINGGTLAAPVWKLVTSA